MSLATAGLSVTETRGVETLSRHLDELLDARILEDVLLRGRRLEDHVEREQFGLRPIGSADDRLQAIDLKRQMTPRFTVRQGS